MAKMKMTAAETGAWTGLIRASQLMLDHIAAELKRQGLPALSWYDVLLELDRGPDGKLRLNELGKKVLLSKFNVSRLVDRLEAQGYVKREPCTEDARGAYAVITGEGRALCRRMWPVYHGAVRDRFLEHFSNEELARMTEWMYRIVEVRR